MGTVANSMSTITITFRPITNSSTHVSTVTYSLSAITDSPPCAAGPHRPMVRASHHQGHSRVHLETSL